MAGMGEWSLPTRSLIQPDGYFRVLCQNIHMSEIKWPALGEWDRKHLLGSVSGHANVLCECAHPPVRLEPLQRTGNGQSACKQKGTGLWLCRDNTPPAVCLAIVRMHPILWTCQHTEKNHGIETLAQQIQDTVFLLSKTILFLYAVLARLGSPDVF